MRGNNFMVRKTSLFRNKITICLLLLTFAVNLPFMQYVALADEWEPPTLNEEPDKETYIPKKGKNDTKNQLDTYVERVIGNQSPQNALSVQEAPQLKGAKLKGNNAKIYAGLAREIAAVAAGESVSSIFRIDLEELGLEKTSWSRKDLDVDYLVGYNYDGTMYITDAAKDAVDKKMNISKSKILKAVLNDYPNELYWYDRTSNIKVIGFGYSADEKEISLNGSIEFRFPVVNEYSAGERYTVNVAQSGSVHEALRNAQAIVQAYSALTDFEKLEAYRNEICARGTYDPAMEPSAPGTGPGLNDPWQMIHIFDADPTTNSSSAGYTKAFQYLCSLTTFQNPIQVINLSGTMNGALHFWNVVTMENGQHYLADISACDTGLPGEPDYLFLAGSSTGAVETGYAFSANNGSAVTYVYSPDMIAAYTAPALTMAPKSYSGKYDGQ